MKKITDFQNASLKLENRKNFLQQKIIEIDKEIMVLSNDHGNFKPLINYIISKYHIE